MKSAWIGIGFSHHKVPSLSKTATRSPAGTPADSVRSVNSTTACLAVPSFQLASTPVTPFSLAKTGWTGSPRAGEHPMSGRVGGVTGSSRVDGYGPEHGSGVGPAPSGRPTATTTPAWPRTSSLVLGALPTAPSCARLHTGAILHEWGLAALAETADLVVWWYPS